MLKVKDCLSGEVITARRGTPLKDIIKIFREHRFHTLPVVNNDNKLVGEISLNDITTVFQPQSAEINQLLKTIPFIDTVPETELDIDYISPEMGILVVADEIMSKEYFTVGPEEPMAQAYSFMKVNNIKKLMVIENDELIGVIGMFDIIYAVFKEKGVVG
ncbi:HPP family protein [Elusimicrobiota bacterium]